ncbi:MAG: crossover junction endodeoxyribonuclease RuvC [Phycisphaerae bacterium]
MNAVPRLTPLTPPAAADTLFGVDTGLQRTGYAILSAGSRAGEYRLVEAGVVRIRPQAALEIRLAELLANIGALLDAHAPRLLACEELYAHYKHPRTAILMGHARGVVLAAAAARALRVIPVSATRVKKTLTGNGHASKAQVQRAVAATLGLARVPEPSDVADAIAIALCGLRLASAPHAVRAARAGASQ